MRVAAIIPARYHSTRLPAKPLQKLGCKCIIEWVYNAVHAVIEDVVVATDDERIAKEVERFGGRAIMTSSEHPSGTDRCAEALAKMGGDYDVVVNVQGDEPFIRKEHIGRFARIYSILRNEGGLCERSAFKRGGRRNVILLSHLARVEYPLRRGRG